MKTEERALMQINVIAICRMFVTFYGKWRLVEKNFVASLVWHVALGGQNIYHTLLVG